MNRRLGIVILFALVISVLASTIVYKIIASKMVPSTDRGPLSLMVASRDLPPGTIISASDVHSVDWRGYVPPRALQKPDQVVGRGVLQAVYEGDPMLETRLAQRGAGGGLAATIPVGMRAVAVKVDEVVGVSGYVVPGMKVDVLVSGTPPSAITAEVPNKISKIVLQNISVLSAGQNMHVDAEGKPITVQVVNLLVTPEQAERLSLASNETKIQLVLRNPLDTNDRHTNGVALASLFSDGPAIVPVLLRSRRPNPGPPAVRAVPIPPVRVQEPFVVEVLRGGERANVKFNASQPVD